jgi:hypothetical protein
MNAGPVWRLNECQPLSLCVSAGISGEEVLVEAIYSFLFIFINRISQKLMFSGVMWIKKGFKCGNAPKKTDKGISVFPLNAARYPHAWSHRLVYRVVK